MLIISRLIGSAALFGALAIGPHRIIVQGPASLTDRDLGIAGLSMNSDSAQASSLLGAPQSVRHHDYHGNDEVLHLTDWTYSGLTVSFYENGKFYSATITGRSRTTARGLRAGDSIKRLTALYGSPISMDSLSAVYHFAPPGPHPSNWGMIIHLQRGVVRRILVGVIGWVD